MRTPLVVGNWKMNGTLAEARALAAAIRDGLKRPGRVEVVVCPPFTALAVVGEILAASPIALGAQNCHHEASGAHTGEVSPPMLAKLNASYVIVGHSERRELFGETDEDVNRKLRAVLAAGMTPIMCVGETLDERDAGGAVDKCGGQVEAGLAGVSPEQVGALVIAYEPIWAIGTGRTATPGDAQEIISAIRAKVKATHGDPAAASVRIQYGGSVKPANAAELMAEADIDGALVGGASLEPDEFARIVRYREG